jgi:hypothetical protein
MAQQMADANRRRWPRRWIYGLCDCRYGPPMLCMFITPQTSCTIIDIITICISLMLTDSDHDISVIVCRSCFCPCCVHTEVQAMHRGRATPAEGDR